MHEDENTFQIPVAPDLDPRLGLGVDEVNRVGGEMNETDETEKLTKRATEISTLIIKNREYYMVKTSDIDIKIPGFAEEHYPDLVDREAA